MSEQLIDREQLKLQVGWMLFFCCHRTELVERDCVVVAQVLLSRCASRLLVAKEASVVVVARANKTTQLAAARSLLQLESRLSFDDRLATITSIDVVGACVFSGRSIVVVASACWQQTETDRAKPCEPFFFSSVVGERARVVARC